MIKLHAVLRMKKACLLQLVLVLLLVSVQVPVAPAKPPKPAKLGNINEGTVIFELGDYPSGYVHVGNLVNEDGSTVTGGIWMYNDTDTIYIAVLVWVKPYLAYGKSEIETSDGSGVVDSTKDKDNDGTVDRYDLKSDGIIILVHADPMEDNIQKEYRWFVDMKKDGSHTPDKGQDAEIDVPSWNANLGSGGILEGQIEYFAEIPIADVLAALGSNPWDICVEVHASPKSLGSDFVVPEFPLGTLSAALTMLVALLLFTRLR